MRSTQGHRRRVDWDCVDRRVGLRFRGLVDSRDSVFSSGVATACPGIEIYGLVRTRGLSHRAVPGMTRVSGLTDYMSRTGRTLRG